MRRDRHISLIPLDTFSSGMLILMRPAIADEFEPPFLVDRAGRGRRALRLQRPPRRARSIRPSFLAESRLDALALAPLRGRLRGRAVRRRWSALGAPLMAARFPRAYPRPEPGALRARSAHVRGPPAALRQHALDAGRRRARHDPAHRRGRPGDLSRRGCRSRRPCGASNGSTSPTTACCASSCTGRPRASAMPC